MLLVALELDVGLKFLVDANIVSASGVGSTAFLDIDSNFADVVSGLLFFIDKVVVD